MSSHTPVQSVTAQTLAVRAISISMGFVFFAGGWRRFYNSPFRHDITNAGHLSDKLVAAAPGSPIESVIHWVLYRPAVAEFAVYAVSTIEILLGIMLVFGLLTRIGAFGSALLNFALMLIFGWMGHECLDEWTMAALGFAVSVTVMFTGSGRFSIDYALKRDWLAAWFTPAMGKIWLVLSVCITVGFYSYYFGFFNFGKRTPTANFRIAAEAAGQPGQITLYVNGGSSSSPAFVRSISFNLPNGEKIVQLPEQIQVKKSHFEPWSHGAGQVTDGVLRLTLGAKVDIAIPEGAKSATIDLIDAKKDPQISW